MCKKFLFLASLFFNFLVFLFFSPPVFAFELNNKFGIHILEPTDLPKAAQLVNSSGGDWGYVTTVLRETDMDHGKWQHFFDDCRRRHLVPIVRIATQSLPGGIWAKPSLDDLKKWPDFLNSLNWPVKQQIVIIFNEPNHAQEWGGVISPVEYSRILDKLISLFKERNENFFVLAAGFDQACGNTQTTMDEVQFLQAMAASHPDLFNQLDGWASHSYPNHGFVGLPDDTGRSTIQGYEWELNLLKNLGLEKELPVFITETGWPHQEGMGGNNGFYSDEQISFFFEQAFVNWQKDYQVQAVTPFVLNYPLPPFDHFSWLKEGGGHYSQFDQVLGISKVRGEPEQIKDFEIVKVELPDLLPTDYLYQYGQVVIRNTGQWIIAERDNFFIAVTQSEPQLEISEIKVPQGELIYPLKEKTIEFSLKSGTQSAEHHLILSDHDYQINVFKPWDLSNSKVSFWQQIKTRIKLWWLNWQKR